VLAQPLAIRLFVRPGAESQSVALLLAHQPTHATPTTWLFDSESTAILLHLASEESHFYSPTMPVFTSLALPQSVGGTEIATCSPEANHTIWRRLGVHLRAPVMCCRVQFAPLQPKRAAWPAP